MTVSAYILIQTEVGKAHGRGRRGALDSGRGPGRRRDRPLRRDPAGRSVSIDELGRMVVSQIQLVDGITRTLTCPVVHL